MTATSSRIPAGRLAALALAALLALALLPAAPAGAQIPTPTPTPDNSQKGDTKRLAGENRFETAQKIVNDAFPNGAENVIVARGDAFPDALAGSYLAGVNAAPIVLVNRDDIPEASDQALAKITRRAFVLGGPGAVSETVVAQLKAGGLDVVRVAGENRYDTARKVATQPAAAAGTFKDLTSPDPRAKRTAFLVTGESFADALAAGPLAWFGKHPVLLTASNALSDEAKSALEDETLAIEQVLIVGGRQAVSVAVEDQVKGLQKAVFRISGSSRNETATKLADTYVTNQSSTASTRIGYAEINLATGGGFPDALALGPRGGKTLSVILLAQSAEELGDVTRSFIGKQCKAAGTIVVAGGFSVITQDTQDAAGKAAICGSVSSITATPATYTRIANDSHEVVATVLDAQGNPVAGVPARIDLYRDDYPDSPITPLRPAKVSATGKTDANGQLKLTYKYEPGSPPAGETGDKTDKIFACVHPQDSSGPSTCLQEKQRSTNLLMVEARQQWYMKGFKTVLTGDSEVPGPGDPQASGIAVIAVTTPPAGEAAKLCWLLDITGLESKPTAAHIHKAPAGEAGDPVVTLRPVPSEDGFAQGCAATGDYAQGMTQSKRQEDILTKPEEHYVNVHTEEFPDGAVRGQLK